MPRTGTTNGPPILLLSPEEAILLRLFHGRELEVVVPIALCWADVHLVSWATYEGSGWCWGELIKQHRHYVLIQTFEI